MKKLTYSFFIAFWSCIVTLVAVDALSPDAVALEAEHEMPEYTLEEVAKRDSVVECWMAIEGKVYDFTEYIPDHPSPPAIMLEWCGTEATEGMRTKGYGRDHSPRAWAMMEDYLIGTLAGD